MEIPLDLAAEGVGWLITASAMFGLGLVTGVGALTGFFIGARRARLG